MSDELPGAPLVRASASVTVAHGLLNALTYLAEPSLDLVFLVVSAVLFVVGTALAALGLWNGIQRSRLEQVTLTGLTAISAGHVPASIRRVLWGLIVVQTVLGVLFASLRPFTDQAFGLLVPMFGLGIAMVWGSRFGVFHPRDDR